MSCLPESEMVITKDGNETAGENVTLTNDNEKVRYLLKLMSCNHFSERMINNFKIARLGKARDGYNRVIKIIEDRDEFLKNSGKLKNSPKIWKKVYIKNDQHPVYIPANIPTGAIENPNT